MPQVWAVHQQNMQMKSNTSHNVQSKLQDMGIDNSQIPSIASLFERVNGYFGKMDDIDLEQWDSNKRQDFYNDFILKSSLNAITVIKIHVNDRLQLLQSLSNEDLQDLVILQHVLMIDKKENGNISKDIISCQMQILQLISKNMKEKSDLNEDIPATSIAHKVSSLMMSLSVLLNVGKLLTHQGQGNHHDHDHSHGHSHGHSHSHNVSPSVETGKSDKIIR